MRPLLISAHDLKVFESSYVFAFKIASELGVGSGYLVSTLIENELFPVSGPKIDGGPRYVFRISDLKRVRLPELVSHTKVRRIRKYKEPKLFSVADTAELLGIGSKVVHDLVAAGVMKPHQRPPSNINKDDYFFSGGTIKRYKGLIKDYMELVSGRVAAEILGTSSSYFYQVYVHRGRITAVKAHSTRGHQFFRLEDVNHLVELQSQTIGTAEAAEILGIYSTGVNKLVDSGKLKVVSGPRIDNFGHNRYLRSDVNYLHLERMAAKVVNHEQNLSRV
jgi:hypothetical protein